jgi:hypothetical protein
MKISEEENYIKNVLNSYYYVYLISLNYLDAFSTAGSVAQITLDTKL